MAGGMLGTDMELGGSGSSSDDESGRLLNHANPAAVESRQKRFGAWILSQIRLRILARSRLRRRKQPRRPWPRLLFAAKVGIIAAVLIAILTPVLFPSYTRPPAHYRELSRQCEGKGEGKGENGGENGGEPRAGCANPRGEKVFIAAILYDRDGQLASGKWGQRVLALVHLLGPENVFLSIYENDSGPEGRAALDGLRARVPCANRIVSDVHVDLAEFPGVNNVTLPDGSQRTKRVAYLAELRNRALRPLDYFRGEAGSVRFDKVLFLNDIAFQPVDAAHLLFNTNQGWDGRASYVAACGLDWSHPFRIYDIFALRDAEGYANDELIYPFFAPLGRAASRAGVLAQSDAVRVRSCWGGMMAMQAEYVQNLDARLPIPSFQAVGHHAINPDAPRSVTTPVRFRHEPGMYYDACECCLFSADLEQVARRAGAVETGIYVNPYIRVAYDEEVLSWLPIARRWERLVILAYWYRSWFIMPAKPQNPSRAVAEGERFAEEVWDGESWKMVDRVGRSGLFCGVRQEQVLRESHDPGEGNWMNMPIPAGQANPF